MSVMTKSITASGDQSAFIRMPLKAGFRVPSCDLGQLLESLGTKLFTRERTLIQYVTWSLHTGLVELVHDRGAVTPEEVSASTPLTSGGADALLSVLSALQLFRRSFDGRYSLTQTATDYLLRASPFYIGDQLEPVGLSIPGRYMKRGDGVMTSLWLRLLGHLPKLRYGTRQRIDNQHARNLSACTAAVKTGEFAQVHRIADIAGGGGVFAIPLALEYPQTRVVLTELPRALPNIRPILAAHGVADRVDLCAQDVFEIPWRIPECDGIFIGNFLHGFGDAECVRICREAFNWLSKGGAIWLHEMVWNDTRDGPLITALWHAALRSSGDGSQRTGQEWELLLQEAGFADTRIIPTASGFALVAGRKITETRS
jgi:hypothetical protein